MWRLFLVLSIAVLVSACSSFTQRVDDDAEALAAFSLADLRAAEKHATARRDAIAATCYGHLARVVEARLAAVEFAVIGPVTAFDQARAIRRRIDEGLSDETKLACSALFNETRMTFVRIARLLATP